MWPLFITAFSLGLIGSVHCVGMCGPLVLALPVQRMSPAQRSWSMGLYHAGRILVYALGGGILGLLGRRFYLAGWQQGLSIGLGAAILLWVAAKGSRGYGRMPRWAYKCYSLLLTWMTSLWRSPGPGKFLLMGMANGLLPCGMVYVAIAAALTSAHETDALLFMVLFGLGTLPMLFGLQMTGHMVSLTFRRQIRRALPYLTAFMAVLLILRGLNLGIPLISPVLAAKPGQVVLCH